MPPLSSFLTSGDAPGFAGEATGEAAGEAAGVAVAVGLAGGLFSGVLTSFWQAPNKAVETAKAETSNSLLILFLH